ncbi:MAG: nucleotidyl transferase AbiEii/AbiGii toxin family protein [Lentimicrobiaceae bacterium]|nr:nucleotidyl transferase AbiEii/AbiGii toxin family protein [Lentimicrobiaceae bacterium]
MYPNILTKEQKELLPFLQKFKREFYLVGGTAIALQIGHRQSVDFDLFKQSNLNFTRIQKKISVEKFSYQITRKVTEQINIDINSVKVTFFQYPYFIDAKVNFENCMRMPDLLTLAAMKAFALGQRSKWKDYVDLYFLLKNYYTLDEVSNKAKELFNQMFSEKLFRGQLAFHKDINYSEQVEYMPGFEVGENEVKEFLIDKSLQEI